MGERAIEHPIIGAWSLQDWVIAYDDGSEQRPYGDAPVGRILYAANGQMLAAIARAERPPLSAPVPHKAPQSEKLAAFDSYFSYGGRFEIDGDRVIHHVEIALNPNFLGSRQVRLMDLDGDRLTLSASEPTRDGERHHRLEWRRVDVA